MKISPRKTVRISRFQFFFRTGMIFLCFQLFLFKPLSWAQEKKDESLPPEALILKQEGQWFSVKMVMGEPIRLFVVGREEARLDLSNLDLQVRRLKPYPGKFYRVERKENFFVVSESDDLKKATDIEVKTSIKNKVETLHFKLDSKKP